MSVINTNITAMIGQQNLNESKNALSTSMERLSSGLRINSAKDDAAGQAIANRMSSQITGLSQAQRNANDGISVAQTTEGALNQVNDNLQRIRELAVQAENGTNSQEDLTSIQNEINQRLDEIDRISDETSFNGTKVLQEDTGLKIQVGANDGEAISVNLKEITADTLGLAGFNVDGSGEVDNEAATADDLTLAGFTEGATNANGSVTYTKDTTTDNAQMTSADLMSKLDDGASVSLASTSATSYSDNTSTGINFSTESLSYSEANDNFTYDLSSNADAASVASNLTPGAGEGQKAATIDIGGQSTDVLINEDGSIENASGEALYIDGSGNLTATTNGDNSTYANATVDNLTAIMAGDNDAASGGGTVTTITAADGSTTLEVGDNSTDIDGSAIGNATITLTDSGTSYAGSDDAGIDVDNIQVSKESVANMLAADGGNMVLASGIDVTDDAEATQTQADFDIDADGNVTAGATNGALTDGDAIYVDAEGNLTEATETTETTTYYAQESGMVTDNTGAQVFKDAEGTLTMDAVTEGERTEDALGVLDSALSQVDSLRSDLGAIQNRFESAITNLSTTETNLSAARSRIEDADYATEVANMTRNQILQQAGTSVLAQANQLPQSALSLLG
ncbi:Flagellin [Halomonas sp. THAF12]|uniref:flagellin N-terminal helical domain-containing protein n=1 Tax=Halomonas sp. THAF12 TaxID=2587849 RepID=UPI0012690EC4|nr:flagellin [Halomonas sp. THAF12]QFT83430.1 Flagellin [Halomonas sp. THAF12]